MPQRADDTAKFLAALAEAMEDPDGVPPWRHAAERLRALAADWPCIAAALDMAGATHDCSRHRQKDAYERYRAAVEARQGGAADAQGPR